MLTVCTWLAECPGISWSRYTAFCPVYLVSVAPQLTFYTFETDIMTGRKFFVGENLFGPKSCSRVHFMNLSI